ncbi:hypothetical protein [Mycobacterium sp. Marseille-P9652]|uniref:hypothetical protein n=1 Tax=Mycobacterium sp. Marseille-P9652 TaxID=2654950 RepID=UPI0012E7F77B|nr:hypothetical protein [Mycobacterium sp. Marseille-P9652]
MFNHHHRRRSGGGPNGVVIDLLEARRDRLRAKFGPVHPALWVDEPEIELATVIPFRDARRPELTS